MRSFFFYGCALLIGMYLLGTTVLFPWVAFFDALDDGEGSGGYYRGTGGGYHK